MGARVVVSLIVKTGGRIWHKKNEEETNPFFLSEPSSSPIWRLRSWLYRARIKKVERKVRVRVYILARGSPISMWERTHPRTPAPDPDRSLVFRPLPAKEVVNSPEGVGVIARIGPYARGRDKLPYGRRRLAVTGRERRGLPKHAGRSGPTGHVRPGAPSPYPLAGGRWHPWATIPPNTDRCRCAPLQGAVNRNRRMGEGVATPSVPTQPPAASTGRCTGYPPLPMGEGDACRSFSPNRTSRRDGGLRFRPEDVVLVGVWTP